MFESSVEASRISRDISSPLRLGIIGSSSFHHPDTEETCHLLGELLAGFDDLVIVTGGTPGVPDAVGRSFFAHSKSFGKTPSVYHILPQGYAALDYGKTFIVGKNMGQRREVLAQLCKHYVVLEGGPGTRHECKIARKAGATLIPVGRSGGVCSELAQEIKRPTNVHFTDWDILNQEASAPEKVAEALHGAVRCLIC